MPRPGRLVVLEGVDGAGKTSLVDALLARLRNSGILARSFTFPGRETNTLGELVNRIYHGRTRVHPAPTALQVLVTAAHVDVIETRVLPALASRATVVLDRFWWSTWVYARAEGVPIPVIDDLVSLEKRVWQDVVPAPVFYIRRSAASARHHALGRLYEELISADQSRYEIQVIDNDDSLAKAADRLFVYLQR